MPGHHMSMLAVLALGAWMAALFSLGFTVAVALLDRTSTPPATVSCPSADYHPTIFGTVRPCGSRS
ncbi:hypothetical protein FraQA3DRAFT_4489 [Frankia sp. QA3]|nr:hypothetical protein FraQA3DRAFT_4489 [Frankia sp. QA3]